MESWRKQLKFDPIPPLLAARDPALVYFARRDLLGEDPGPIQQLWVLPGAQRILRRQLPDGAWPGKRKDQHPAVNDRLIETWRWFRFLMEQYGFTREDPRAERAAEFLFSCQTAQGDIRGFLADQYATYYTGAVLALLIQAGYADDPRVEQGLQWLLDMRQDDGGWTVPLLTHRLDRATLYRLTSQHAEPLEPDRSKPFSHNWTGMALRAFAHHPRYRTSEPALRAAELLKSRFFQPDVYTSYQSADYWLRFEHPFWWNNLLAVLDTLGRMGYTAEDPQVRTGLEWFRENQYESGLWKTSYGKKESAVARERETERWVSLAVGRVMKRLEEGS